MTRRQVRGRPPGIRTSILVGVAAALAVTSMAAVAAAATPGADATTITGPRAASGSPALRADEGVVRYAAVVTVSDDGSLEVAEDYFFGRDAGAVGDLDFSRSISTREQYDADNDRVYDISDIEMSVDGEPLDPVIRSDDDSVTISDGFFGNDGGGTTALHARLSYRVDGAVAQTADGLEVRWPVVQGLSTALESARVEWNAPGVLWLSCLAGAPGSSRPCTTAQLIDSPTPRMSQVSLPAGDQMVGILGLTADSGVAPSVDLEPRWSLSRAFTASGAPLWLALGIVVIGLVAAFGLWWTRGRDAGVAQATEPIWPFLDSTGSQVAIAPPGGVRPGQVGTLVDERADVVDVSATVIDLATRNYLFIEEIPRGAYGRLDWRLRRRNELGAELLPFEREVLDAVFAGGDEVLVSELADSVRSRLGSIQGFMYDDLVRQGWFAERPDAVRGRWTTAGWVLVVAGAVLAVALALAGTFGLVGLAVVLAGVALALSGQLAPARTTKGAQLLRQLDEFRGWMSTVDLSSVPLDQREQVVSRLYPYALVLGLGDAWGAALAGLDEDPDPDEPIYWYGAPQDWHLSDIGASLEHLSAALNAALGTRRLLA